ncbi:MAG: hypothetical protein QXE12_01475 [Conexivisphaerales archaeon]
MQDRIFVGYLQAGSDLYLSQEAFSSGLLLRGRRCIRIARNLAWELFRRGKKVIVISLLMGGSSHFYGFLPRADLQSVIGYIFTYGSEDEFYQHLLAVSLTLGFDLERETEYTMKEAIRSLASAEGAGGAFAIVSMMEGQQAKGVETAKKRLQELFSIPFSRRNELEYSFITDFWKVPSAEARIALALACMSKMVMSQDCFVFIVGWEAISYLEKKERTRFNQLLSEIMSRSTIIALQNQGEGSPNFGAEITEAGPLYIYNSKTVFAAPELITSSRFLLHPHDTQQTNPSRVSDAALATLLKTIESYKGATITGLMTYLTGQLSEDELKLALETALFRRLAIVSNGENLSKVLELTEKGKEFLNRMSGGEE